MPRHKTKAWAEITSGADEAVGQRRFVKPVFITPHAFARIETANLKARPS
jgi:hypothetical protein